MHCLVLLFVKKITLSIVWHAIYLSLRSFHRTVQWCRPQQYSILFECGRIGLKYGTRSTLYLYIQWWYYRSSLCYLTITNLGVCTIHLLVKSKKEFIPGITVSCTPTKKIRETYLSIREKLM